MPLVLQAALTFLAPSIILRFVGNFILPESRCMAEFSTQPDLALNSDPAVLGGQ